MRTRDVKNHSNVVWVITCFIFTLTLFSAPYLHEIYRFHPPLCILRDCVVVCLLTFLQLYIERRIRLRPFKLFDCVLDGINSFIRRKKLSTVYSYFETSFCAFSQLHYFVKYYSRQVAKSIAPRCYSRTRDENNFSRLKPFRWKTITDFGLDQFESLCIRMIASKIAQLEINLNYFNTRGANTP